jgi:hypothetical protein
VVLSMIKSHADVTRAKSAKSVNTTLVAGRCACLQQLSIFTVVVPRPVLKNQRSTHVDKLCRRSARSDGTVEELLAAAND